MQRASARAITPRRSRRLFRRRIRPNGPGEPERLFRYAPADHGDRPTVLARSSSEWIGILLTHRISRRVLPTTTIACITCVSLLHLRFFGRFFIVENENSAKRISNPLILEDT
jgi:hypothetical protein